MSSTRRKHNLKFLPFPGDAPLAARDFQFPSHSAALDHRRKNLPSANRYQNATFTTKTRHRLPQSSPTAMVHSRGRWVEPRGTS